MSYLYFEETQKFRQAWLWILMIVSTLFAILVPFLAIGKDLKLEDAVILILVPGSVFVLFYILSLKTRIDTEGIHYRFFPFHFREKTISWSKVEMGEVIKYNPIGDFGGWGIKYGRKGKAYNVSGNMGLYLTLKNKKRILIGTQRPEEMAEVVTSILKKVTGDM